MEEILWIWDAPLASDLQDHQNTTKHTGPNSYQIYVSNKNQGTFYNAPSFWPEA